MTTPVANTGSTTTQTQINTGISRLADNEQTFLALLTTQLKNQDPLSPLDSNQFTAQITQMTGVEQQLTTNKLLQQLVDGKTGDISSAVGLIGKIAQASGSDAALKNGAATWNYSQAADAKNVTLQIKNADGTVIWRGTPSDLKKGDHAFTWNGKSDAGVAQPNGVYTLTVAAADASGTSVTVNQSLKGAVTGVEMKDGVAMLTINGVQVPLSTITSVESPAS
jgi:flagellar basal-body rod modification protein FlgD